jgi:pimeloyl-ACP methyl ester carboxylesterase
MNHSNFKQLFHGDNDYLTYEVFAGHGPTVVFLGGYASEMTGTKGEWLRAHCNANNYPFLRLDYSGHGQSSGEFEFGTIGQWLKDALRVIEKVVSGPMVLVGSSMGGWIMLLVALKLRQHVVGLIGIAAAPDFSEDLMWQGFDSATQERLKTDGIIHLSSEYDERGLPVRMAFIEDGREHCLLKDEIELHCPVRLLQGMEDLDVPWETASRLMQQIASVDVEITYIKNGDHRLSSAPQLRLLGATLDRLLVDLGCSTEDTIATDGDL